MTEFNSEMTCRRCQHAVTSVLESAKGVQSAYVNLTDLTSSAAAAEVKVVEIEGCQVALSWGC